MSYRSAVFVLGIGLAGPASALECTDLWSWLNTSCRRAADTYTQGGDELMISGYSYHLPSTWTPERRAELNANAWGIGYARTVEDPDGDTHTDYAYGFLDSHKHIQLNLGYAWSTYWGSRDGLQAGLGYTVFLMQRPDIANGFPVPAALPIASLRYKKATLLLTFIPTLNGGVNHGSTLYVLGRVALH